MKLNDNILVDGELVVRTKQKEVKIVAAFRGMHVSPAKHSYGSVTDGQTDGRTDRQTTSDKVIPVSLCFAGDTKITSCEIGTNASIYLAKYPEHIQGILKYISTICLAESRCHNLGWV